tara:strand:- start:994 stop:2886 length:1893 start_codon:yes stop_codon:yes gene_type:complete
MSSPFRKTSAAIGKVGARQKEYQDSFAVKADGEPGTDYHKAKTRRNAYVTITVAGVTLPTNPGTYDALYSNTEGKPDVILEGVSITEGSDLGMMRTVEASFECLSRAAFDTYEPIFCRPGNKETGRTLTVNYGYVDGSDSGTLKDCIICKYAYELTDKNTYKCSFKAYGPGPFINQVQAAAGGTYDGLKIVSSGFFKSPVVTLPQYLKYVAQGNGAMANIDIPNWTKRGTGVIVADNPNSATPDGYIMRQIYKVLQAMGLFSADASKKIYCTLEWFVDTLQTYHIKPNLKKSMKGRSINASNTWLSNGAHTVSKVGSAYPMSIVLPGAGHYGSSPIITGEDEMDFDSNNQGIVVAGDTGDYRKILLSYDYIASKVFGTSKEKGSVKASEKSDKTSNKDVPPDPNVNTIMKTVFNDIYHATGGLVHLSLMEDSGNSMVVNVIPKNSKAGGYSVTTFDPINGDGITRKCTVKCDVPANDAYAVANGNGGGAAGGGMVTSLIAEEPADPEPTPLEKANTDIDDLMSTGVSANSFDNEDCDALQAAFKSLIDNQPPDKMKSQSHDKNIWPLNLEIELDGADGFRFGDVVGTTFMPSVYNGTKVQFVVTSATHEIGGNDWVTKLKTQCFLGEGAS